MYRLTLQYIVKAIDQIPLLQTAGQSLAFVTYEKKVQLLKFTKLDKIETFIYEIKEWLMKCETSPLEPVVLKL